MEKRRGMDAVAFKGVSKRRAAMKRKGGLSVVIAVGKPSPKPEMEEEEEGDEMESPSLTCPKCGAELADTEENRAYLDAKGDEEEEQEDDYGEGPESEEEMDD